MWRSKRFRKSSFPPFIFLTPDFLETTSLFTASARRVMWMLKKPLVRSGSLMLTSTDPQPRISGQPSSSAASAYSAKPGQFQAP